MRTNLLEKAFHKTINETLKNTKNKLKNTTEEEILNSLTDVFITHSTEAFTKLEELDILLSKEIINLRDIKSKEYINEILESYTFNDKISFVNKISEIIKERKDKKNELICKLEKLKKEEKEILKINGNKKEKFNNLIDSVYENN